MSKKIIVFLNGLSELVNTPGLHIIICIGLVYHYATEEMGLGHDVAVFALGVLARSMGPKSSSSGVSNTNIYDSPGTKVDTTSKDIPPTNIPPVI